MTDQITVPTFEQIEAILSKLATNYSNLAILFYDIFYNTTPTDVTFQMYNEEGVLETFVIPNRAKDMANILNGEGSPEGNIEAGKGVLYQDLSNGDLYIKLTATSNIGWTKFVTNYEMSSTLIEGIESPEGVVFANKGTLYVDKLNASLYIKAEDESNVGWVLISANTGNLVDRDLSNLTVIGEAHFANPSLSNININGQAKFDAKEDVVNKVTSISSASTDIKYPSAKAVYDFVGVSTSNFADKDLSNISFTAENKFVSSDKLRDCVLEAPTIMFRGADNSYTLPYNTVLLCANGLNAENTLNNKIVTIPQNIAGVIPTLPNESGRIFYDDTYGVMRNPISESYFYQIQEPEVTAGGVWFNPVEYTYHVVGTVDEADIWIQVPMAEVGRWTTDENGDVKTFKPYYPAKLVNTESRELDHVIIEVGGDDSNWYRLSKNGWIEAGGCGSGNTEIAFYKNFKSVNYTFVASGVTSYTKAVDGVMVTATGDFDWIAKGWIA